MATEAPIKMTEHQLAAWLGRRLYQAMNDEGGDLSDTRQSLFDRYYGEGYGTERDGYSKFTTREVLEAVEWAKPALLRIFTGSDRYVSFDAVGPEDEEAAAQETDVVNYRVNRANGGDGFIAIHNFITDALMYPTAYIKAYIEEEERVTTHTLGDQPATALAMLVERDDIEIIEQDSELKPVPVPVPNPMDPENPTYKIQQVELFDIRYKQRKKRRVLRIESVPGEESLVDNNLTTVNLDHSQLVAHRTRKTYTELVNMGFDAADLDEVGSMEDHDWNDEYTNRMFYDDENPDGEDDADTPATKKYWVHDCYVWVDYDGDGVAEFRNVVMIGAKVFENEEVNYQPMCAMSSVLVPHKHNGLSIGQLVDDLQELLTMLTRQLLDNIYKINTGRKAISEDSMLEDGTTMEAMLNVQSEWIPVRGPAVGAIVPEAHTSLVGEILPVIQDARQATSMRSGIAPENNVDPDVLQQTTMGAFMGAMEAAGERLELIARIMAETGFKQLFRKVHQLCRMYPDIVSTVKLRNEWVEVDPSGWEDRTDMSVNVGLGLNSKQTMMGLLQQLLVIQKEAIPMGLAGAEEIYNSLEKLIDAAGLGSVEQFFKDPTDPTWQPPQPPPDPNAILAQAQAQGIGMEQQRKNMEAQAKIQGDAENRQIAARKNELDAEGKRLDNERATRELAHKERELVVREKEADAGIRNTDADTFLKNAQEAKTLADAGKAVADRGKSFAETDKTEAETERTKVETSDEVRTAREIIDGNAETEAGGSEESGGDE